MIKVILLLEMGKVVTLATWKIIAIMICSIDNKQHYLQI